MTDPNGWPTKAHKAVIRAIHEKRYTRVGSDVLPMDNEDARYCGALARAALSALMPFVAARVAAAAEAMREACRDAALPFEYCPCGGPPCQTPPGHGCGQRDEIGAAIRALPLPAPDALARVRAEAMREGMEQAADALHNYINNSGIINSDMLAALQRAEALVRTAAEEIKP
jgi:hypothetical protein